MLSAFSALVNPTKVLGKTVLDVNRDYLRNLVAVQFLFRPEPSNMDALVLKMQRLRLVANNLAVYRRNRNYIATAASPSIYLCYGLLSVGL